MRELLDLTSIGFSIEEVSKAFERLAHAFDSYSNNHEGEVEEVTIKRKTFNRRNSSTYKGVNRNRGWAIEQNQKLKKAVM